MKTFEEQFTAWVDGKLAGAELAEFEKTLRPEHLTERESARRLRSFLREHAAAAPAIPNAEFLNHQLAQRIAAEEKPKPDAPARRTWHWTLPRMAWAGAACGAVVLALYLTTIRHSLQPPLTESEYLAQVLDTRTGDPAISATAFHSQENDLTVIWLDGLTYLPGEYGL
jgi:hypothetical protein